MVGPSVGPCWSMLLVHALWFRRADTFISCTYNYLQHGSTPASRVRVTAAVGVMRTFDRLWVQKGHPRMHALQGTCRWHAEYTSLRLAWFGDVSDAVWLGCPGSEPIRDSRSTCYSYWRNFNWITVFEIDIKCTYRNNVRQSTGWWRFLCVISSGTRGQTEE